MLLLLLFVVSAFFCSSCVLSFFWFLCGVLCSQDCPRCAPLSPLLLIVFDLVHRSLLIIFCFCLAGLRTKANATDVAQPLTSCRTVLNRPRERRENRFALSASRLLVAEVPAGAESEAEADSLLIGELDGCVFQSLAFFFCCPWLYLIVFPCFFAICLSQAFFFSPSLTQSFEPQPFAQKSLALDLNAADC